MDLTAENMIRDLGEEGTEERIVTHHANKSSVLFLTNLIPLKSQSNISKGYIVKFRS